MAVAILFALVVAVIALLVVNNQQSQTIEKYENELIKKARKGKKSGTTK